MEEINEAARIAGSGPTLERRIIGFRVGSGLWGGGFIFLLLLILCLIVMAGIGAAKSFAEKGWGSDVSAWIQAVGSVLAILAAGWIAGAEKRNARSERRREGEDFAWAVRFVLVQAQLEAQIVAFEASRDFFGDKAQFRSWKLRVRHIVIGIDRLLSSSAYVLHPAVSLVLSNAKVLCEDLLVDIDKFERKFRESGKPDRVLIDLIVGANFDLAALVDSFDARMRGIETALDDGDGGLPRASYATRG